MASTDEIQPKEVQSHSGDNNNKPKLKFRNYNPQDEELKEKKLPKAKPESVETQILDQLEAAKDPSVGDVNLANLAPRKIDWDLKRDIAKKLEKLERRTQRAVVELIRDRLKEDNNDLASAVSIVGSGDNLKDTDQQNDSD